MLLESLEHLSLDGKTFLLGLVVFLSAVYFLKPRKKYNLPPRPWTFPLVGNVYQLMTMKKRAYEAFYDMGKQPEYGPVFRMKFGGRDVVLLNNIEVIREALINSQGNFAGRPKLKSAEVFFGNGIDILMGQNDPVWRFHRKMASTAIRNYASGKNLETIVQNMMKKVIDVMVKENKGKAFDVRPYLTLSIFNLCCGICFGKEYDIDDPEFNTVKNMTLEMLEVFGNGLLGDMFPALSSLPTPTEWKVKKIWKRFFAFIENNFQEDKKNFDASNLSDFADFLINTQKEAEERGEELSDKLTDDHLVYTVVDVFGAGLDTLVTTLHWAIAYMVSNQKIQEKLYQEVNDVCGDELPTIAMRNRLPYLEAFMNETMRIGTVAPLGIPLATTVDTKLNGYDIPQDTMVMINIAGIHMSKDYWQNPEEFRPERFLEEDGKLAPKPIYFMPFSAGKRVCLGEQLAKNALLMMIPMLVKHLKFVAPSGGEFKVEAFDSGVVNMPKNYKIVIEERV